MAQIDKLHTPTKAERKAAWDSYEALAAALTQLDVDVAEVEIEETKERLRIPLHALKLLSEILKATAEGKPISIVPIATEMTTQTAAEILGCSRPHVVKLLEEGKIPFSKVGKHRRVKYEDLAAYQRIMKAQQRALLVEMMKADEASGLYDS
jgi:excisionase family DNA binding protein